MASLADVLIEYEDGENDLVAVGTKALCDRLKEQYSSEEERLKRNATERRKELEPV